MASNWFPRRAVNLKQISFAYTPMSPTTTSRLLQLNYNWILFSCCFRGSFSSSFRPCQHRTFFETCVGLASQTEKSKIFAHRRAGEHKKKTHKHRPKVGQLQIFAYFCWSPVLLLVHCAVRHFQLFLSFAFEPWISNRRINDWGDFLRRCRSLHILLIGFRVFFFLLLRRVCSATNLRNSWRISQKLQISIVRKTAEMIFLRRNFVFFGQSIIQSRISCCAKFCDEGFLAAKYCFEHNSSAANRRHQTNSWKCLLESMEEGPSRLSFCKQKMQLFDLCRCLKKIPAI